MSKRPVAVERRRAPRMRTLLGARIEFIGGKSSLDCRIRDLSPGGARLQLGETSAIPNVFRLYIPKFDTWHRARVRWHGRSEVGIEFDEPRTGAGDGMPARQPSPVDALEAEVTRLRCIVEAIRADPARAGLVIEAAAG